MIRRVELQDAKAITTIYNEYVRHSVATFETEPLREEDMHNRIAGIAVRFPYFDCGEGRNDIQRACIAARIQVSCDSGTV